MAETPASNPDNFPEFAENASGRYYTVRSEDIIVLELIPAFGRLFASVGYYMDGKSLYSYYAAEIQPLCPAGSESCPYHHSQKSYDVYVRLFSNMSMAGSYWPGETFQRLTVIENGLLISDHAGDGYGLVSEEDTLMNQRDELPSMFPYGPEEAGGIFGDGTTGTVPEFLTGSWTASAQEENTTASVRFSLGPDGTITMLCEQDDGYPPLFLKGGVSVSLTEGDGVELCYLMSSPSSGTMPYSGCVPFGTTDGKLTAERAAGEYEGLFLPENAETMIYERE
ncbi:MAG: hypothetical protein IKP86_06830 [Anaerolineaceae bacterium]|nr:hypothetical protein [Anaerolineaceae bacterium]